MAPLSANIGELIKLAGLAQAALAVGSLVIPRILNWRYELAKVRPLIRQMFWTYAAYIFVINLSFGFVSLCCYRELTNGSRLATLINGFIAIYWISRVAIQFLYFDRRDFPVGKWNTLGEVALVTLFVALSIIYGLGFYLNFRQ